MITPDTGQAVLRALGRVLDRGRQDSSLKMGEAVEHLLEADRKALAEQGFAIVKRGEIPEWMQEIPDSGWSTDCKTVITASHRGHGQPADTMSLYRLKTEGEE